MRKLLFKDVAIFGMWIETYQIAILYTDEDINSPDLTKLPLENPKLKSIFLNSLTEKQREIINLNPGGDFYEIKGELHTHEDIERIKKQYEGD